MTNNNRYLLANDNSDYSPFNANNPETGAGGDSFASYLLGVINGANRENNLGTMHEGAFDGSYLQDSWLVTNKLMLNFGMRHDILFWPTYGTPGNTNRFIGSSDIHDGTCVIAAAPPACGSIQGAPCLPGGALPDHVRVTSLSGGRLWSDSYDNFQPRIGMAYRCRPNTVIRGAFGMFADTFVGVTQVVTNPGGTWPSVTLLNVQNANTPTPSAPTPTLFAQNPFNFGTAQILTPSTVFPQAVGLDPAVKNPLSDQWNIGVEHQFGNNTVLSVNYVGACSYRVLMAGTYNTAMTPGPGTPALRSRFPWMGPAAMITSDSDSNYSALEVSMRRTISHGLTYTSAYTWSKTMDFCSDAMDNGGEAMQDPYHLGTCWSPAGQDLTHMFSGSAVYPLPFRQGSKLSTGNGVADRIIGGWVLSGILTLDSGPPYTLVASGDVANTGAQWELADVIGNPHLANPTRQESFNTAALVTPPTYTIGDFQRDTLRQDWIKNLDLSLFRTFRITESKQLEFRGELFNAGNFTVYGTPGKTLTTATFGQVTSLQTGSNPRQIQLGAKFYF